MKFCPQCGVALVSKLDGGRDRPACPTEGCGFIHYGHYSIGVGAVVVRDDCVLLIERRTGGRSWWQIPGGYVEADEPIHAAIEREVLEETGVTARVTDVVGFRHAAALAEGRPAANIYLVFRLEAAKGEPRPDGEESFQAGFFSAEQRLAIAGLSAESRWAIEQVVLGEAQPGLRREPARDGLQRAGHTLFGLPLL